MVERYFQYYITRAGNVNRSARRGATKFFLKNLQKAQKNACNLVADMV